MAPLRQFVSFARPARYPPAKAGEHLYAHALQSFSYPKERLARGELRLPDGARALCSFGHEDKLSHERDMS